MLDRGLRLGSRVRGLCRCVAFWLAVVFPGAGMATQPQDGVALLFGQMTQDSWDDIAQEPGGIDWEPSWLVGMALSRDWQIRESGFSYGLEVQALRHFGEQTLWEFSLPVVLRYRAASPPLPVSGAAFGLGLSWTSEVPQIEVERKGESQRLLAYWMAEVEFGNPSWDLLPFLRLHHRSDGGSVANFDTGSNAVMAGIRFLF